MTEIDTLTPMVARVLKIEDITTGDPSRKTTWCATAGQLLRRSAAEAYDRLAELLQPIRNHPAVSQGQRAGM